MPVKRNRQVMLSGNNAWIILSALLFSLDTEDGELGRTEIKAVSLKIKEAFPELFDDNSEFNVLLE